MYYLRITALRRGAARRARRHCPAGPSACALMQANWIGRSEGVRARVSYDVDTARGADGSLQVFTTRADTLFGVTFMAVAAEHPLAQRAARGQPRRCRPSSTSASATASPRPTLATHGEARHADRPARASIRSPASAIPVWVANYVLMGYGDGRGHGRAGARRARLRIRAALRHLRIHRWCSPRTARSSTWASGRRLRRARRADQFGGVRRPGLRRRRSMRSRRLFEAQRPAASGACNWRLRDWGISRQRYWGCPIPLIHCEQLRRACRCPTTSCRWCCPRTWCPTAAAIRCAATRPSSTARARSAAAGAARDRHDGHLRRLVVVLPALRERRQRTRRWSTSARQYWLPVDQYIGGIEHAILHLLYSRFWTRVMRDLGLIELDGAVRATC